MCVCETGDGARGVCVWGGGGGGGAVVEEW